MISWFSTSRIRAYVKLSTKKQNQVKRSGPEVFRAEVRSRFEVIDG